MHLIPCPNIPTGKLSVISKSFRAFLLPNLAKKKIDRKKISFYPLNFFHQNYSYYYIFMFLPFYPQISKFWLGRNSYNDTILNLTKIFTVSVIFSCALTYLVIVNLKQVKHCIVILKLNFF